MSEPVIKISKIDCVAGMRKIQPESVAMVFADPPYNLSGAALINKKSHTGGAFHKVNEDWDTMSVADYSKFSDSWISESYRILNNAGAIYVCASHHNIGQVMVSLAKSGFVVKNIITWEKPNAMPNMTRRTFTHSTEFIVWAVKGKGWVFNHEALKAMNPDKQADGSPKMMRDVWRIPVVQGAERLRKADKRALHPTQKPEVLVARCVEASTNEGDLVVDPFSGSGTTAVICALRNRSFLGFELSEEYVRASRARVTAAIKSARQ